MRAENTIQWVLDLYPDLNPTRKHVLNHLFCVIGNGYHWVNGELVDDDPLHKRYKMIGKIKRAKGPNEDLWNQYSAIQKLHAEKIPDFKPNPKMVFHWYPLSQHSYLFDYPDDIKPDWLAVLNECKELLIADGIEIPDFSSKTTPNNNIESE